ncbi:hypothetical protein J6590_017846 [Homalodisca vitripennis]|nr:hypothetical protein J6590_017846 [Homalodisca vitripennis]
MLNLEYVGITVEREMLVALRGTQENSLSRPDLTLLDHEARPRSQLTKLDHEANSRS